MLWNVIEVAQRTSIPSRPRCRKSRIAEWQPVTVLSSLLLRLPQPEARQCQCDVSSHSHSLRHRLTSGMSIAREETCLPLETLRFLA